MHHHDLHTSNIPYDKDGAACDPPGMTRATAWITTCWKRSSAASYTLRGSNLTHICYLRTGLLLLIQAVMRLKRGGYLHAGVPCSAHVWIARNHTKKTYEDPRGDPTSPACAKGNAIASRTCMILLLACVRECWYSVEQPGSSMLLYMEMMAHVLNKPQTFGFAKGVVQRLKLACKKTCISRPGCACVCNQCIAGTKLDGAFRRKHFEKKHVLRKCVPWLAVVNGGYMRASAK